MFNENKLKKKTLKRRLCKIEEYRQNLCVLKNKNKNLSKTIKNFKNAFILV